MPAIAVNGIRLNVERVGEGPPLVLLHGFTGSTATWAPHLDAFSGHFSVIAVDLPGHGASDAPADPARYGMEQCVSDLLALFDRLEIARASLLGYSMGGRVALNLAIAAPERIRALVLECASPGIADPDERLARRRSDAALADMIEREGIEAFVDYWERLPLFASQAALPAAIRDRQRAQRLANTARGLATSLRRIGTGMMEPLHDRLGGIQSPVLLIAGERDEKYCRLGRSMAGAIPAARLVVVPDAGHAVHLEQPEAFHRHVLEFLESEGCHDPTDPPGFPGCL
jgi:2-succinyl-6-hydroxy-2,4-cyclohexadiene-1-carboxylate synthase